MQKEIFKASGDFIASTPLVGTRVTFIGQGGIGAPSSKHPILNSLARLLLRLAAYLDKK